MGHRFEEAADSSIRNLGLEEKKENRNLTLSTHSQERSNHHDDSRGNEVVEFVKLMDRSGSSDVMRGLLFKILNSNKCEELKQFLNDRSYDTNGLKKKAGKANVDTPSVHDRSRKQAVRRSSTSKTSRSEMPEQITGSPSSHSTKTGMRKSTRTRTMDQGNKTNMVTATVSTRMNSAPTSPMSSLLRSRQSDSCLRRKHRDAVLESPSPKSKLSSSSSLLQLRTARRGDLNRRRTMVNLNQAGLQAEKQNASWDPVPGGASIGRNRRTSTGSLLNSLPVSPGKQNASWDSAFSPTKSVNGADKLRHKGLGKISEKGIDLFEQKKNPDDENGGDEDRSVTNTNDSKLQNSFAQFSPMGKVTYLEQTVRLHDLVDDLRLNRDSNRDPVSPTVEASDKTTSPEKKGLRKYLKGTLTKKKVANKDKQSMASESGHDNYRSLSDGKKFHLDMNDSVASFSLQGSIVS